MAKVWNKRDPNCPKDAVYIGRPSKWGNPFLIGRDGTREEVIKKYRNWLVNQHLNLVELWEKDLVCWCSPKPCHGDVLLELANKSEEEAICGKHTS